MVALQPVSGQQVTYEQASSFIEALISDPVAAQNRLKRTDALRAEKHHIQFKDHPEKSLIAYGYSVAERKALEHEDLSYTFEITSLKEDYSKLDIRFEKHPQLDRAFVFHKDSLVSSLRYFSSGFSNIESKYFRFHLEHADLINPYSISLLDEFVDETSRILGITTQRISALENHKIDYYLLASPESVKRFTGYASRGQFNMAYDAVISTYNAHFHEVVHFLINYKLESVYLYTHPLLQEGLAVALGGRGGINKAPLFEFAEFAINENLLSPESLLHIPEFRKQPASVSYPVAGYLVTQFLSQKGVEPLLDIYTNYSAGDPDLIDSIHPDHFRFEHYDSREPAVQLISEIPSETSLLIRDDSSDSQLFADDSFYYFQLRDTTVIGTDHIAHAYKSTRFETLLNEPLPAGAQYLITVNESEIAIYDVLTNQLLANYVSSFQPDPRPIETVHGAYLFKIRRSIFSALFTELYLP